MAQKNQTSDKPVQMMYRLSDKTVGYAEKVDNCWNYSIFAMEKNVSYLNEFNAGYVQGKLQGETMLKAARNNTWKNLYLTDTSHTFPRQCPPSKEELKGTEDILRKNLSYLFDWICAPENINSKVADALLRLYFRMQGIYEGAAGYKEPDIISFGEGDSADEILSIKEKCKKELKEKSQKMMELPLGYGDDPLSFLDVYFINAQMDLADAVAQSHESKYGLYKSDHCSAFLKRVGDDIFWTHNSWCGFLTQSMTVSYSIYDYDVRKAADERVDFVTQNCYCAGQFGSNMDFGFNKYGICFNETTHRYSYNEPKKIGIWLCWRAAAAEMFAKSIDEFYEYLIADNTGTYLNGYMLIDAKTNKTALIEMSYKRFVKFLSDGKTLVVTERIGNEEKEVAEDRYDHELITPEYIFGVNYPVSNAVAEDLQSTDNRPMRRIQFKEQIGTVVDMESTRNLITYVGKDKEGKEEPLSIFGRWDLGYGTTEYPKTIADGAVDAKAYSVKKVKELLEGLKFQPNGDSLKSSFWMRFGTPEINGKPFIWTESKWKEFRDQFSFVPNKLEGAWNETKLFMD